MRPLWIVASFWAGWLGGWQKWLRRKHPAHWITYDFWGWFAPRMDEHWARFEENPADEGRYHLLKDLGAEYTNTPSGEPSQRPYHFWCIVGGNIAIVSAAVAFAIGALLF